jgi:hypothetical protein
MPTALIEHGANPSYHIADETGLRVESIDWKPQRKRTEKTNYQGKYIYVKAESAKMDIDIKGKPIPSAGGAIEGLADAHPGVAVAITNYAAADSVHGFVAPSGVKVVVGDPTRNQTLDAEAEITIPCTFYPDITPANHSSATS